MTDTYDIVVAGGGLAGMSAGVTAARLGRSVLILTGGLPGGLLLNIERIEGLAGFPEGVPGYELCPATQGQAEAAGAQLGITGLERLERLEHSDGGWSVATGEGEIRAAAVIIATGASFKRLEVPGEEDFHGRGISTCASCDGPLLRGKTAVVVGGGDSALQEALALADAVERVVILHRGEELAAQASYRERVLQHPKIEVRFGLVVEEILGEDAVRAVRVRGLGDGDASEQLEVAAVFPFVGLSPNTSALEGATRLDGDGHVLTDGALRTAREGLLAAGIVRSGATARAAAAGGEGAAAALAAHRYLDGQSWPEQVELARTGAR